MPLTPEQFLDLQKKVTAYILENPESKLEDLFIGRPPNWRLHPDDPCAVTPRPGKSLENRDWLAVRRLAIDCKAVKHPTTGDWYWPDVLNSRTTGEGGGNRGFRGSTPEQALVLLKAFNSGISPTRKLYQPNL